MRLTRFAALTLLTLLTATPTCAQSLFGPSSSGSTSVFTGATSSTAGTIGLVPAPAAGNQGYFLRGDSTWQPVAATTPPVVASYVIASQNVVTNAVAFGTLSTRFIDTNNAVNASTGTFTAPVAGNYRITVAAPVLTTTASSAGLSLQLFQNGNCGATTGRITFDGNPGAPVGQYTKMSIDIIYPLVANDKVNFCFSQAGSGVFTTQTDLAIFNIQQIQ